MRDHHLKRILFRLFSTLFVISASTFGAYHYCIQDIGFGGSIDQAKRSKLIKSPQYHEDHFENNPTKLGYSLWPILQDFFGGQQRLPPRPLPILVPQWGGSPSQTLKVYWLGHATVLIELEGKRMITDPILSQHSFPFHMLAPKRYSRSPIKPNRLPKIDFAVISHDHFDHLDRQTVKYLSKEGTHFFVGLGVGVHLEAWGVPIAQIHEHDWWDQIKFKGIDIHCTPARHYSGRKAIDNSTLWTSWLIKGQQYSVFHSGDTGYGSHFKEIYKRLGAVDLTLMKIGDYGLDLGWQDIHMTPEQSVKAHQDLHAKIFLPIHWGTFNLSYHAWDEPIIRALKSANRSGIALVAPMMGQAYSFGDPIRVRQWWTTLDD
jgi:L-ascorbate metabolism protein UlaG (beta-lactamase superfamily)